MINVTTASEYFSCAFCRSFLQHLRGLESHIADYHALDLETYKKKFKDYAVPRQFTIIEEVVNEPDDLNR